MMVVSKKSQFAFFTIIFSSSLFFSCGQRLAGADPTAVVDNYSINKASQRLCGTNQRLLSSSSVLNLDMNTFAVAGGVKSLIFVKGTDLCALKFTKYDFNNRLSSFAGQLTAVTSQAAPPQTFNYDLTLQNADSNSCISNGSAWEVLSVTSTNTNSVQTILRNLSDSTLNQTLALNADKIMKASSLASALGISAYTCQ